MKTRSVTKYLKEISEAFTSGDFSTELLTWMFKQKNDDYLAQLPPKLTTIHIPCEKFVDKFGKQVNYRTRLHSIMEALPATVIDVTLNGLSGARVMSFHMRRVLEAMQGNQHIQVLRFTNDKLFTLREFRKHPTLPHHKPVEAVKPTDLFDMLMRAVGRLESVTTLDFYGCDPFPTFDSSPYVQAKLAELPEEQHAQFIEGFKQDIIAEYKKKFSQVPANITIVDLGNNPFDKFSKSELDELLSVLHAANKFVYVDALESFEEVDSLEPAEASDETESVGGIEEWHTPGRYSLFATPPATPTATPKQYPLKDSRGSVFLTPVSSSLSESEQSGDEERESFSSLSLSRSS